MARILLIEDEDALADALRKGLRDEGYAVDVARDGEDGLWAAQGGEIEVVVLDLLLPKLPGLEICRRLRQKGNDVPILMLTALDATADVVAGLDAGANDYVTKPVAFAELLARIRALLRVRAAARTARLQIGPLVIDTPARLVVRDQAPVTLTPKEYQLLEILARHEGEVLSKSQLTEALWERDAEPDSNAIEVYMANLRRKIDRGRSPRLLHTVRGAGYVLRLASP